MLSKSNRGAYAEFRVALYCLGLGFEVYRNLMPNGATDMILTRRGYTLRCQVKSAGSHSGVANAGNPKFLRQGNNDVLAICTPDGGGIIFKVRSRKIQKLFPGSMLARPPKRK